MRTALYSTGSDIWVINADGSGLTHLAADSGQDIRDRYPAWSPDGTKITFESDRTFYDRPECPCQLQVIVVMDASGANLTDVAFGERPDWQPVPGPQRSDYENAAKFCKAERAYLGEREFRDKYGSGPKSRANAYGKCVSQSH